MLRNIKNNLWVFFKNEAVGIYLFLFFVPINTGILPYILLFLILEQLFKRTPILKVEIKKQFSWKNPGMWLLSFYIMHLVGLFYTKNMEFGMMDIGMKASLAIFPVFFLLFKPKIKWSHLVAFFIAGAVFSIANNLIISYDFYLEELEERSFTGIYISRFYHRGYWAIYLLSACFFALKRAFEVKNKKHSFLYFLAAGITIFGAILTESKMGLIVLSLLLVFMSIKLYRLFSRKWVFMLISLLLIGGVFSSIYFNPTFSKRMEQVVRFFQEEDSQQNIKHPDTNFSRLFVWRSSVDLIKENFWTGVGTGDIKDELKKKSLEKGYIGVAEYGINSHNQFLNSHIAIGIVGSFSLFMAFAINFYRRENDKYYFWRIGVVFILFLASLTESTLEVEAGIIPYAFFLTFFTSFQLIEKKSLKIKL